MEFPYVERTIVQINKTVLMITSPNMAIRCSMIGSTKHTSLRVTDRIDDPPKQASEIVISPYDIEYILNAWTRRRCDNSRNGSRLLVLIPRDLGSNVVLSPQRKGEQCGLLS